MRPRKVKHNQDKLHSTLLYTEDGHLMTRMCPDSLIKDNSKHYTVSVQLLSHTVSVATVTDTLHTQSQLQGCVATCYQALKCHKKYSIMSYKKRDEKIPQVPTVTYMHTIHYNNDYMYLLLLLFIDSLGTSSSSMSARGSPPVAPPPPLLQLS